MPASDEDIEEFFQCDLCGTGCTVMIICDACMSARCEPCHDVHGCNCPEFVIR